MQTSTYNFLKNISNDEKNIIVGVYEGGELSKEANELDKITEGSISFVVENSNSFKGKKGSFTRIQCPKNTNFESISLLGLGKKENNYKEIDIEKLGAKIIGFLKCIKISKISLSLDSFKVDGFKSHEIVSLLASGALLKSYDFNKYKVSKKRKEEIEITFITEDCESAEKSFEDLKSLAEGVFTARNLVNEPGNILTPKEFMIRACELRNLGVEVEVLDTKKMQDLEMNALLGVAQGSINEPYMVVMKYNPEKSNEKPVALVGKGVTFDSGGISIKPANKMDEMKGDMGGAAVVMSTIKALALRKAKTNVVGVIGLVENMPSGTAQRPGDIVKAANGKTIEILNTDAEGRLVLADALWYTEKKLEPKLIIDLATLTGAVLVALGIEYSAIMSDDDDLVEKLISSSNETDEKLWRLPLHKNYDKNIDSEIADVKNIGAHGAGTITAAHFLKRFVENTPWAHLDIAGTFIWPKNSELFNKGATGFGVRLLNNFIKNNYES